MNKVILFETELANITTPSEDRRDEEGLYNPYTIRQWQKEVPFMNWTYFFNDAFKLVNRTVSILMLFFKKKLHVEHFWDGENALNKRGRHAQILIYYQIKSCEIERESCNKFNKTIFHISISMPANGEG